MCVLPSATEEAVGMLNLAAPKGLDLSLDPDIMAALDDDFDFEDPDQELEDDFIGLVSRPFYLISCLKSSGLRSRTVLLSPEYLKKLLGTAKTD